MELVEIYKCLVSWLQNQIDIYVASITLPFILILLYGLGKKVSAKYSIIKNQRSLFPYYTRKNIEESQNSFIRTKCQNIDPANETNFHNSYAFATKEDLLNFYLKKVFRIRENDNRFYLILADSGMGKSTFLLNLYSRYKSIFYVHLNKMTIKLFPLGEKFEKTIENIKSLKNPSKTILLLDGFDELPTVENSNINIKFNELINLVDDFAMVIVTCRTHFFSTEKDEPFELKIKKYNTNGGGYHIIKKLYISPFDITDIKKYIGKTFKFYEFEKKSKAYEIVDKTSDLMARPMLLSYIKEIIIAKNRSIKTGFDIFEVLISNWIEREANNYPLDERLDFKLNLIYFSYATAKHIYSNYETNGIYIPYQQALTLAKDYNINLNEIEIKSKSLLNRNSIGDYKFSHKSILEFFLGFIAYNDRIVEKDRNIISYDLDKYNASKKFIEDIVYSKRTEFIIPSHRIEIKEALSVNKKLYSKILTVRNYRTVVRWEDGSTFLIRQEKEPFN